MTRQPWRPGPPLLGLLAGWLALFAWSGMVTQPAGFLLPTLVAGLVLVLAGAGLRVLGPATYVVVGAQLLLGLLALNVTFAARESLAAVIPTPDSVRHLAYVIGNGAATLNQYSSPVEVNPTHTRAMLMGCALAVLFAIDVLAISLRRPSLAALPLLVALSVPVSILRDGLALPVFVGTALLFLRLLGTGGSPTTATVPRDAGTVGPGAGPARPTAALTTLWQISIAAVVVALLAAPLVPVTDLLHRDQGDGVGEGDGTGRGLELTDVNPFIRLRRELVAQTHTPLVYAETTSRNTGYLRTTVLDEFTSEEWRPSSRQLPSDNDANGVLPFPPGLAASVDGTYADWSLQLAPAFRTTWLPLPYPIRELEVPGSWRYDSRTLDVALVDRDVPAQLRYRATAFTPTITAGLLDTTAKAPDDVLEPMTKVPRTLPAVIATRAKEVTKGAKGDFAKAVALQDWFRDGGGFRYSLEPRAGSGMDLLAAFVTDDRVGYCEQFAAAMAAMGRTLGIPSRVAVGFLNGRVLQDGRILYTSDDRHAWPEMYFAGVGWVRFEPTPGQRAGATPSWTRQDAAAPEPTAAPRARASEPTAPRAESTPTASGAQDDPALQVPWWPVTALLGVLVAGLTPGLVRRLQRRRRLSARSPVHLAEGAWAELRATALDLGLDWPELRSPREQASRVAGQVQAEEDDLRSLEQLLVRVERGRYGRVALSASGSGDESVDTDVRTRTVETVEAWRRAMADSVDRDRSWSGRVWRRVWRGRVWPVSLLRGRD
jgi:transglutaminase-like putative cysteine protease